MTRKKKKNAECGNGSMPVYRRCDKDAEFVHGRPNNIAPLVYAGNRWHGAVESRGGRSRHGIWTPKVCSMPDGALRGDLAWKIRKRGACRKAGLAREKGAPWPSNHIAPTAMPM